MQEQLGILKEILIEELAWYSTSSIDQEFIYAQFAQLPTNKKIDNIDWVSWVFEHRETTHIFVRELFEKKFPGKEIFVWIGSTIPGKKDYLEVLGQNYFSKN